MLSDYTDPLYSLSQNTYYDTNPNKIDGLFLWGIASFIFQTLNVDLEIYFKRWNAMNEGLYSLFSTFAFSLEGFKIW